MDRSKYKLQQLESTGDSAKQGNMSSGKIYFFIFLTHWYYLQESLGKAVSSASEMSKYICFLLKREVVATFLLKAVSQRCLAKTLLWKNSEIRKTASVLEFLCSYFHISFIKKRLAGDVFLQICKICIFKCILYHF